MKKILVVDDDLHIQKLYKEELEEEGYEVLVAAAGPRQWSCLFRKTRILSRWIY